MRSDRIASLLSPLIACVALSGCGMDGADSAQQKAPKRVPTSGIVTLDGKPLAGAVVTFLPIDEAGSLTVSDVGIDGDYALTYVNFAGGTAPGKYKVGISYEIGSDGRPVDLAGRSALQRSKAALAAVERLPKKYSDLGATELKAEVPAEGGTFDFKLEGPLLPGPDVILDAVGEEAAPVADPNFPQPPMPK